MKGFDLVAAEELELLTSATRRLSAGFDTLPEVPVSSDWASMREVLDRVADRMTDNYPYAHPLYAGQMLKPPHPVARAAYQMAMWVNPNNHALDGGRASSALEKEAVAEIANMFGFETVLGHLTSSGTIANLEALWIAGRERPGKQIAASAESHYTHQRISSVLGLSYEAVPSGRDGRIDIEAVRHLARAGNLGTVVATAGTTSFGIVDPVADLIKLAKEYDFRVHVDAAYGGYFMLADLPQDIRRHYDAIRHADSVVIDPHKHGLQPYGCGCVLFSDVSVGKHYRHDSPYTYFSSDELHLGEISLECSRAGAAATALWATQKLLPLQKHGAFAGMLNRTRAAARQFTSLLRQDPRFTPLRQQDLDIVVWALNSNTPETASRLARQLFDACADRDLHLALIDVDTASVELPFAIGDTQAVTCLRSCLMKPEHLDWIEEIYTRLCSAYEDIATDSGN